MVDGVKLIKKNVDKDSWLLSSKYPVDILGKWQETINLMAEIFNAPASFIVQKTSEGFQVVIASKPKRILILQMVALLVTILIYSAEKLF